MGAGVVEGVIGDAACGMHTALPARTATNDKGVKCMMVSTRSEVTTQLRDLEKVLHEVEDGEGRGSKKMLEVGTRSIVFVVVPGSWFWNMCAKTDLGFFVLHLQSW